ncbi:MAG: hypothetical protein AB1758_14510 [Candidatus Eremiobacterota bacterium]
MILAIALFTAIVVVMFVSAAIAVGPTQLTASAHAAEDHCALAAANAGLEYALARLREDATWRGDANATVVDDARLIVVEDRGNVVGLLFGSQDRVVSQFRLRFNYYDGNPGADQLPDPSPGMLLDHGFVSVNNLAGAGPAVVPRGDPASGLAVTDPTVGYPVPSRTACILVEGRAGPALRSLTRANPNAAPARSTRLVQHVAEAYFQATLAQGVDDAPLMGGRRVQVDLEPGAGGKVEVKSNTTGVPPRLRSKKAVRVTDGLGAGDLFITAGQIGRDAAAGFSGNVIGSTTFQDEFVGDGKDFYNLKWEDVRKADSDPNSNSTAHIPAGVYVAWSDGTFHYYDMTVRDYRTYMSVPANQSDPGVVLSSADLSEVRTPTYGVTGQAATNAGVEVKNGGRELEFSRDVFVKPTPGGTRDFVFIPRRGAVLYPGNTDLLISGGPADSDLLGNNDMGLHIRNGAVMSVGEEATGLGRFVTVGEVRTSGGASITTQQELVANAKGFTTGGGLSLYAKGDIKLSSYKWSGTDPNSGSWEKFDFQGVIYTWGAFRAHAGHPGTSSWGDLTLTGAIVAYGADPATGSPGSAPDPGPTVPLKPGIISIQAKQAILTWDQSFIPGMLSSTSSVPTGVRRILYATY